MYPINNNWSQQQQQQQQQHFDLNEFSNIMLSLPDRLDWETYHLAAAALMGSRSNCGRLHVGCVIVDNSNCFVSAGYNGFLPGAPHVSVMNDGHEQATVHAEQNAVANAAKRGVSVDGATAYITHKPCVNCGKVLAAAGIKEIVYIHEYGNDMIMIPLLQQAGVTVRQYSRPALTAPTFTFTGSECTSNLTCPPGYSNTNTTF